MSGSIKLATEPSSFSDNILLHEGKEHRFNFASKYLGEQDMTFNYRYIQDVDVVSVLVYNGGIELAFDTGKGFVKRKTVHTLSQIAKVLPNVQGFITGFERRVESGCVQYIYVYITGSIDSQTFLA